MLSMLRRDGTRSLRTTLLLWFLPFAAVFMAVVGLIHGFLLERMPRNFLRERLHLRVEFVPHPKLNVHFEQTRSNEL